ncbi:MAG: type II toxin-antitoxin system VapC family toxin [Lentimicrobiaceae bacterium]|nr:type II toxin-antitoxin system VapC family toxin [Lentimicrobiaceae bacterium]
MVTYLVVDTCVLSDILKQYNPSNPKQSYVQGCFLSNTMVQYINQIVTDCEENGYIIASVFAFVELINKFKEIFIGSSVTIERIKGFMLQPPSWFIVEPMTEMTAKYFSCIPNYTPKYEPISSDDAVHLATALQRGDDVKFLTSDHKLIVLNIDHITFLS